MKTLFFSLFCLICIVNAEATVRTVSNDPSHPAQYSSLQTAIDASALKDTVYIIPNSALFYGNITIRKRITLIGNGINGFNQGSRYSFVDNINIQSATNGSSDSTSIIGVYFKDLSVSGSSFSVNGIQVVRSSFFSLTFSPATSTLDSQSPLSSAIFIQSIFYGGSTTTTLNQSNCSSLLFFNCILSYGRITGGSSSGSYFYDHCNFIGKWPSGAQGFIDQLDKTIIQNSIFLHQHTNSAQIAVLLRNCLTYDVTDPDFSTGVILENCKINQDPKLLLTPTIGIGNQWFPNNSIIDIFNKSSINLQLQSSSPAKNAGTDGTDIGITGGAQPWDYLNQDAPVIPRMQEVTVQSGQSLPSTGGTLQIKVRAKRQAN